MSNQQHLALEIKSMAARDRIKSIFPHKLWQMINDCRLRSAIRWTDDGKGFYVFENQLKLLCLGKENKMFYTQKPRSFIRQLHLYGFRKINKNQFTHQFFQRDKPNLLYNIKRAYKSTPATSSTNDSPILSSSPSCSLSSNYEPSNQIAQELPTYDNNNQLLTNCYSIDEYYYDNNQLPTIDNYSINEDNILSLYNNDVYNTFDNLIL